MWAIRDDIDGLAEILDPVMAFDVSLPIVHTADYVAAVKACWRAFNREEKLSYEGEYWNLSLLPPDWAPRPHDHPMKVDISAVGPVMTRVAGEVADGVHVHPIGEPGYLRRHALPAIAAGERLAAFALTEPQAGSDAAGIRTTAIRDGDHYVVNGIKQWITNGGDAEIYTVVVMTNPEKGPRGASTLVIEKDTPGFGFGKKEDKMGIRASSTRELVFEDCRVPVENLLGREGTGFITAMTTFDASRPGVGAQALGIAQGALDLAVDWAISRKQFGSPVSSFQGLRFLLADMAMQVEAARALIYATSRHIDGNPKDRSTIYSAMSKCFASDVAMRVTTDAVQVFGGSGYMRDYPIEKFMRDAKITQIYEGTNQIQREEISRILIGEHISGQT